MMRALAIVLILCAAWWLASIGIQQKYNVPVARHFMDQKIEEFKSMGFDTLAAKAGRRLVTESLGAGDMTFPLKYTIERVDAQTIKVTGRLECIQLVPFTDMRTGPGFEITVSKDTSYHEG